MSKLYTHDVDYDPDARVMSMRLCGRCVAVRKANEGVPYIGEPPRLCDLCSARFRRMVDESLRAKGGDRG